MKRPVASATVVFLGLLALAQWLRFAFRVHVEANGRAIPVWLSAVACLVLAALAVALWRESRRP